MPALQTLEFESCVPPTAMIRALRQLGNQANWSMKRLEGSKMVDRWAVIIPLAQHARTIGLAITAGPFAGLEVHCWSHTAGSAGAVHHSVWTAPKRMATKHLHTLIQHWAASMPRAPFRWKLGERMTIGFALPVFRRSRRAFAAAGVPTAKGEWPQLGLAEWPPELYILEEE
jgi:hypothetical protein